MATIAFKTGDAYMEKLERLERQTREKVCGKAIYEAAELVADEIRAQLGRVPSDETFGTGRNPAKGPNKAQKKGLYDSLGIAPIREDGDGFLNVKIGFDGYNSIKTKRWPKGQPNQMVARSVERGTSYMGANPFVKKAMAATKGKALEQMKSAADAEIKRIMEE